MHVVGVEHRLERAAESSQRRFAIAGVIRRAPPVQHLHAGVGAAGPVHGVAVGPVQHVVALRALQRHGQRQGLVAEGVLQAVGEFRERVADDANVEGVDNAVAVHVPELEVAGAYHGAVAGPFRAVVDVGLVPVDAFLLVAVEHAQRLARHHANGAAVAEHGVVGQLLVGPGQGNDLVAVEGQVGRGAPREVAALQVGRVQLQLDAAVAHLAHVGQRPRRKAQNGGDVAVQQQVGGVALVGGHGQVNAVLEQAQVEAGVVLRVGFPTQIPDCHAVGREAEHAGAVAGAQHVVGPLLIVLVVVVADVVVAGHAVAGAQLQLADGRKLLDEGLLGHAPGQGHRGESGVAVVGSEARRAVRPERRGQNVALLKGVVQASKHRSQRVGGVEQAGAEHLPGGGGVLDVGVGVGARLARYRAAFRRVVLGGVAGQHGQVVVGAEGAVVGGGVLPHPVQVGAVQAAGVDVVQHRVREVGPLVAVGGQRGGHVNGAAAIHQLRAQVGAQVQAFQHLEIEKR